MGKRSAIPHPSARIIFGALIAVAIIVVAALVFWPDPAVKPLTTPTRVTADNPKPYIVPTSKPAETKTTSPLAGVDSVVEKPDVEEARPTHKLSSASVQLVKGVSRAEIEQRGRNEGFRVSDYYPEIGWVGIESTTGNDIPEATLNALVSAGLAQKAEPAVMFYTSATPTDPSYSSQWGFKNTGQSGGTAGADMNAEPAWNWARGDNTVIAVIDEGVMNTHPDLVNQMWVNAVEAAGTPGVDDDGNGRIDDINGWDFANGDASVYDENQGDMHGTHVAGTIAAQTNNGIAGAGSAWNAKIMAVKGMALGSGSDLALASAIRYAANNRAKVANCSWGGSYSALIAAEVTYAEGKGMLMVCAAGNSGADSDVSPLYPAALTNSNIISVANLTRTDTLASTSNYGATSVDIGAPGTDILSTKARASAGARVETTAVGGSAPYSLFYYSLPVERITNASVRDSIITSSMGQLTASKSESILIVDDSWRMAYGDPDYATTVYQAALASAGYTNITKWSTASGNPMLTGYDAVIWFTGRMSYPLWYYVLQGYSYPVTSYTFSSVERSAVETYLLAGGDLMISSPEMSDDFDYWFSGMPPQTWYRTYSKTMLFDDYHQNNFEGVSGGLFNGVASSIPSVMAYPYSVGDEIIAGAGSTSLLNWSAQTLVISGTSMASPHVAGAAGLAWSRTPSATMAEIKTRILANATSIPALAGKCTTGGRLNAAKSVGQTSAPASLAGAPSGSNKATITWANDTTDAYFNKSRVLIRSGAPVASYNDPNATVLYEGQNQSTNATGLSTGTYYVAAFSANTMGSWSAESTATIAFVSTPLQVVPTGVTGSGLVEFPNWSASGSVTAAAIALPAAAPTSTQLVSGSSYDITTSVQYSGNARITLSYNPAGLSQAQEDGVRLYHYVGGVWVDITDSTNTVANTVSGYTSTFSPFAIFVPLAETPPTIATSASSLWSIIVLVVCALGIAVASHRIQRQGVTNK